MRVRETLHKRTRSSRRSLELPDPGKAIGAAEEVVLGHPGVQALRARCAEAWAAGEGMDVAQAVALVLWGRD